MSSIAYITDEQMIEFHRLNGTTNFNFWRPGTMKKFSDFHLGDLLFFLAKGTERGKLKEKGIIGYGRVSRFGSMSFNQMWKKYRSGNGYPTKASLQDAILKVSKNHNMPDKLTCLELEQVIFFQSPIYLSELNVKISNRIESYIYLDKDDENVTSEILAMADRIGVDVWSSSVLKDHSKESFYSDAYMNTISNIYKRIKKTYYSKSDELKISRMTQDYMLLNGNCMTIPDSKDDFVSREDDKFILYIPCIVNTIDFISKFQFVLGHYMMYKASFMNTQDHIRILFNNSIDEQTKQIMKKLKIQYKIALSKKD